MIIYAAEPKRRGWVRLGEMGLGHSKK